MFIMSQVVKIIMGIVFGLTFLEELDTEQKNMIVAPTLGDIQ